MLWLAQGYLANTWWPHPICISTQSSEGTFKTEKGLLQNQDCEEDGFWEWWHALWLLRPSRTVFSPVIQISRYDEQKGIASHHLLLTYLQEINSECPERASFLVVCSNSWEEYGTLREQILESCLFSCGDLWKRERREKLLEDAE